MTIRHLIAIATLGASLACRATPDSATATPAAPIDRDLMDVTVPALQRLYNEKKYTVTQVVQWHLDRIDRYNGIYGAIETVLRESGFYPSGLPFGLEFSARPWTDDLLGAAYAWEQATRLRKPPTLVERGMLTLTAAREQRISRSGR